MRRPRLSLVAGVLLTVALGLGAVAATRTGRSALWAAFTRLRGRATVEDRLAKLAEPTRRIRERCVAAGLPFPPAELAIVAFKDSRRLRVFGRSGAAWRAITEFSILGASGLPGPKLEAGDRQVPEGVYPVESLNPNSMFHLAIRVGYPNAFDREQATRDGRSDLGGDIMIHGGSASVGCLAIGDYAIEELFVLVASTGAAQTRVLITPTEQISATAVPSGSPPWLPVLYQLIESELSKLTSAG